MKAAVLVLAVLVMLGHPAFALAAELAACGALVALIIRIEHAWGYRIVSRASTRRAA